jgi:hypothetical protein
VATAGFGQLQLPTKEEVAWPGGVPGVRGGEERDQISSTTPTPDLQTKINNPFLSAPATALNPLPLPKSSLSLASEAFVALHTSTISSCPFASFFQDA